MKGARCLLAAALAAVVFAALPAAAEAAHARSCGSIYNVVGKRDYKVFSTGVACRSAKRWSRTYLRRRRSPRGYRCSRIRQRGVKAVFFCRGTRSRSFYAERR
ncbi:MAG: hypothetical protein WD844_05165 [Thermoleophilaceae bacterium]